MARSTANRERLSIDVFPEEHRQIKAYAALQGMTIRGYVLQVIREQLQQEQEKGQLFAMTTYLTPALKELWDNEKDASYDKV